jgi:hypothetical protein
VTSPGFLADFFIAYPGGPLPAPIELAQNLVLGAVDYAQTLGFDPHPDFYLAKPHLGDWQPPSKGPSNYHFSTLITTDGDL